MIQAPISRAAPDSVPGTGAPGTGDAWIAASSPAIGDGFRQTVAADLYRYGAERGWRPAVGRFFTTPGFRYTVLLRLCQRLRRERGLLPLRVLASLWLSRVGRLYGISIPARTSIAPGFYIGHYGCIVVHPDTVIGRDCNISHGVTIGQTNRGRRAGVPTLGDRVYLGPGAKIIGRVHIGDDVAVGANAVVTSDAPANAVMVGVPARVVSMNGSSGYIQHASGQTR